MRINRLILNTPDVLREDFGEDLVLLNLRSGEYFNFTERSRAFLDAILTGYSPDGLINAIASTDADAAKLAENLYAHFEKHNLLKPSEDDAPIPADTQLATTILAAGAAFPFECFDDLSDLIAADPIHDVSPETGWPARE